MKQNQEILRTRVGSRNGKKNTKPGVENFTGFATIPIS